VSYAKGTECPHGLIKERCRSCGADLWIEQYKDEVAEARAKYPPSPGGNFYCADLTPDATMDLLYTALALDDLGVDQPIVAETATEALSRGQIYEQAYQRMKRDRLAMDYGMSPELVRAIFESHTHRQATETAPMNPDLDDQGERQRLAMAVSRYAQTFHIPAMEGEDIISWFKRVEGRMVYMSPYGPNERTRAFLPLLKTFVAAAMGMSDDDLDALIKPNPAQPGNRKYPPFLPVTPAQQANPQTAPPVHAGPFGCGMVHDPNTACPPPGMQYGKPTDPRCADPACRIPLVGGYIHYTHANPAGPLPATPPPTGSSPAKDSLLNPAPKGFVGARNLPFDSDYD
jgi:hypothetical protein